MAGLQIRTSKSRVAGRARLNYAKVPRVKNLHAWLQLDPRDLRDLHNPERKLYISGSNIKRMTDHLLADGVSSSVELSKTVQMNSRQQGEQGHWSVYSDSYLPSTASLGFGSMLWMVGGGGLLTGLTVQTGPVFKAFHNADLITEADSVAFPKVPGGQWVFSSGDFNTKQVRVAIDGKQTFFVARGDGWSQMNWNRVFLDTSYPTSNYGRLTYCKYLVAYECLFTQSEAERLSSIPHSWFLEPSKTLYLPLEGAGPTPVPLAATSAATSFETAKLNVTRGIKLTTAAVTAETAKLYNTRPLSLTDATLSAETLKLGLSIKLSTTDATISAEAFVLDAAKELKFTSAAVTSETVALDVAKDLKATSAAVTGETVALDVAKGLKATTAAVTAETVKLFNTRPLNMTNPFNFGTFSAESMDLNVGGNVPIAATTAASTAETVALDVARGLKATSAAVTDAQAALSVSMALSVTDAALTGESFSLDAGQGLKATIASVTAESARLGGTYALSATASAVTGEGLAMQPFRGLLMTSSALTGETADLLITRDNVMMMTSAARTGQSMSLSGGTAVTAGPRIAPLVGSQPVKNVGVLPTEWR